MRLRNLLLLLVLLLAACGDKEESARADAEAKAAQSAKLAHEREVIAWRDERVARLTRPDGWLSLVGLHWLKPGPTYVGSAKENGTRLAIGPPQLGLLEVGKDGKLSLQLAADTGVTIDGLPAEGTVPLVADTQGTPTVVGFNRGDASFIVIERGGRFGLRVRNAMSRTRSTFPGLAYFDIDPGFRFKARFEAHPAGKTLDIVNVLGQVEPTANPGRLHFEKDGKAYSLEAVDEGDGQLFLIFADRTSGHDSYAASRFLTAAPAGEDGTTVLDFNKAYNPPCAFTDFSTCPLPPPENRLDLAVTAGEKKPLPYPR